MSRLRIFGLLALAVSVVLRAAPSPAHDLWVAEQDGRYVIFNGHGDETQPYAAATIRAVKAYGSDGRGQPATTAVEGIGVAVSTVSGVAAITVVQDEGFWSLTPEGYKPGPKRALKDVVESSYNVSATKTLFSWSDAFVRPLGMAFEIVPLKNPLSLTTGGKLPIEVRYQGQPLAGVLVDVGDPDGLREKCDERGRIEVTIGARGRQTVSAYHSLPYQNPAEADELELVTNLTFTVK